jgi:hypothetical protein
MRPWETPDLLASDASVTTGQVLSRGEEPRRVRLGKPTHKREGDGESSRLTMWHAGSCSAALLTEGPSPEEPEMAERG